MSRNHAVTESAGGSTLLNTVLGKHANMLLKLDYLLLTTLYNKLTLVLFLVGWVEGAEVIFLDFLKFTSLALLEPVMLSQHSASWLVSGCTPFLCMLALFTVILGLAAQHVFPKNH